MKDSKSDLDCDGQGDYPDAGIDIVYDDEPSDTTIHPAGPEIPRDWPRPQLPPLPPQPEKT